MVNNKQPDMNIQMDAKGEKKLKTQEDSDPDEDVLAKDNFEMIKGLRKVIAAKYKVVEVIGKGSYGCVSKAQCKQTGKFVALKVMKNQTLTEYELIKLLREILLMRKLNDLFHALQTDDDRHLPTFIPELVEILCPEPTTKVSPKTSPLANIKYGNERYDLS